MEYIKICGLKRLEEINLCAKNGATAIGFIYNVPSSPRNLEKSEIERLLEAIEHKIATVVVSKPRDRTELQTLVNTVNVDYYQIHSNFNQEVLSSLPEPLKKRIILALKLNQDNKEEIVQKINEIHDQFFAILIDNSEGLGNKLDFGLVKELIELTKNARVILAGGIGMENIESILKELNPYGIDVSSSLESERGIKDPLKIKTFLHKVKEITN
ncbi:MAG: phosphoribosylanthranilate isomerase [Promethearchaeota archaeon]|nr:MAG: phosphoribosylanthranilate isomerase [Candidatus Lokiarchaeota archaeon]